MATVGRGTTSSGSGVLDRYMAMSMPDKKAKGHQNAVRVHPGATRLVRNINPGSHRPLNTLDATDPVVEPTIRQPFSGDSMAGGRASNSAHTYTRTYGKKNILHRQSIVIDLPASHHSPKRRRTDEGEANTRSRFFPIEPARDGPTSSNSRKADAVEISSSTASLPDTKVHSTVGEFRDIEKSLNLKARGRRPRRRDSFKSLNTKDIRSASRDSIETAEAIFSQSSTKSKSSGPAHLMSSQIRHSSPDELQFVPLVQSDIGRRHKSKPFPPRPSRLLGGASNHLQKQPIQIPDDSEGPDPLNGSHDISPTTAPKPSSRVTASTPRATSNRDLHGILPASRSRAQADGEGDKPTTMIKFKVRRVVSARHEYSLKDGFLLAGSCMDSGLLLTPRDLEGNSIPDLEWAKTSVLRIQTLGHANPIGVNVKISRSRDGLVEPDIIVEFYDTKGGQDFLDIVSECLDFKATIKHISERDLKKTIERWAEERLKWVATRRQSLSSPVATTTTTWASSKGHPAKSKSPSAEVLIPTIERRKSSRLRKSPPRDETLERGSPTLTCWTQKNPNWRARWHQSIVYPRTGRDRATVDAGDVPKLDDGEFLNDNLILFYLRYLQMGLEEQAPDIGRRIYFMNTYFFSTFRDNGYRAVEKWTAKVDLLSYDYIVVPINELQHWYLAIICHPSKLLPAEFRSRPGEATDSQDIVEGDSKPSPAKAPVPSNLDHGPLESPKQPEPADNDVTPTKSSPLVSRRGSRKSRPPPPSTIRNPNEPLIMTLDSLGSPHSPTCRVLKQYLAAEIQSKKGISIDSIGHIGFTAKNLPEQNNFCDCGVFLLAYVEHFVKDPEAFIKKLCLREKVDWKVNPATLRTKIRDILLQLQNGEAETSPALIKDNPKTQGNASSNTSSRTSSPVLVMRHSSLSKVDGPSVDEKSRVSKKRKQDDISSPDLASRTKALRIAGPSTSPRPSVVSRAGMSPPGGEDDAPQTILPSTEDDIVTPGFSKNDTLLESVEGDRVISPPLLASRIGREPSPELNSLSEPAPCDGEQGEEGAVPGSRRVSLIASSPSLSPQLPPPKQDRADAENEKTRLAGPRAKRGLLSTPPQYARTQYRYVRPVRGRVGRRGTKGSMQSDSIDLTEER